MPIGRSVLAGKPRDASGQRDHLVLIQQKPALPTGGGFPVENWTTLASEYMSRLDLRADERLAGARESAFSETQWHMAYRADMDPEMVDVPNTRQLVDRGRVYNIQTASIIGHRQGIELITLAASG